MQLTSLNSIPLEDTYARGGMYIHWVDLLTIGGTNNMSSLIRAIISEDRNRTSILSNTTIDENGVCTIGNGAPLKPGVSIDLEYGTVYVYMDALLSFVHPDGTAEAYHFNADPKDDTNYGVV